MSILNLIEFVDDRMHSFRIETMSNVIKRIAYIFIAEPVYILKL